MALVDHVGFGMRSIFLLLMSTSVIFLVVATGPGLADVYYEESDERDDVVYISPVEYALYHCSDRPDIDISEFIVYEEDQHLVFSLSVYGTIQSSSDHRYSFDVELSYLFTHSPDLMIQYEDGSTDLIYMENNTKIDLSPDTDVAGGTLNISVPLELLLGQEIVEVQVWTHGTDPISGRYYLDSNLPIELYAEKEKPIIANWKLALFISVIALLALYFIFGKRLARALKRAAGRRCPNCNVGYKRRQRSCVYCGEELV